MPEEAIVYPYMTRLEYPQMMGTLGRLPEREIDPKANDLLELFSFHPHRHRKMAQYSKGMKQRVLISAALLHDPDVPSAQVFKFLLEALARKAMLWRRCARA